jgi:hypothetical protein
MAAGGAHGKQSGDIDSVCQCSENPLISKGVYKTVRRSIRLIKKKNFNPSLSTVESVTNLASGQLGITGRSGSRR